MDEFLNNNEKENENLLNDETNELNTVDDTNTETVIHSEEYQISEEDASALEMNDSFDNFDVTQDDDIFNIEEDECDVEQEYTYTPITPQTVKNKGLRVFISILVLVLVAAISASAGYIVSDYQHTNSGSSVSVNKDVPKVELENKPSSSVSSYTDIANKVNPSIVSIMVYSPSSSEYGSASGVVYSKEGYIVTNDHIYDGIPNAKFLVRFSDGSECKASYVAGDVRSDLAVLKLDEKKGSLTPATFGNSDQIVMGEEVLALGYSSQYGDSVTLTKGIISAPKRRVRSSTTNYASTFIQTDATINPGNSGGALCNLHGQVVGITSSKLAGDEYDAVSYAIPTTTMKKVVSSLIADGSVSYRAKLGITYSEIGTVAAEINKVPKGIYIGTISTDSGLYNKGFNEGDVITHVNGKEITSGDVLLDVIDTSNAGDSIELTIYLTAKKTSKTISVKLGQDKGSSSYTTKEDTSSSQFNFGYDFGNKDGSSNGNSSDNSSKTFDFPLD